MRTVARCYFCGMTFLLCISGVYLLENLMDTFEPVRVYNNEGMGTGYFPVRSTFPMELMPPNLCITIRCAAAN